jgi:hypothetical protein
MAPADFCDYGNKHLGSKIYWATEQVPTVKEALCTITVNWLCTHLSNPFVTCRFMHTYIFMQQTFSRQYNTRPNSLNYMATCKINTQWYATNSFKGITADVSDIMVTEYCVHDITSAYFSLSHHHFQNICTWTSTFQALPSGYEQKDKDVIHIVSVSTGPDFSLHNSFANYFQYSYHHANKISWWKVRQI